MPLELKIAVVCWEAPVNVMRGFFAVTSDLPASSRRPDTGLYISPVYLAALSTLESPLDARAFRGGLLVSSTVFPPSPPPLSAPFRASLYKMFLWGMANGPRRTVLPSPGSMKGGNIPPAPMVTCHVKVC